MKVLSKAERENQYRKRADAATRKAASPNTDKRQATLRKIKERLQQLNYVINDEKALEEIIGDDNKLNLDKIGILSERGIISLNEKELEAETPQIEFSFDKHNPTFEDAYTDSFASGQPPLSQTEELRPAPKIKIFSISEELPELPQSRERQTPASRTAEPNESNTRQENDTARTTRRIDELLARREQKNKTAPKEDTPPAPAKETAPEKKEKPEASDHSEEPSWIKGYPASLKKWCETAVDKKTGEPKREIKEVRVQTDENREPASVEIEVRPLSPIARKRGDAGAVYMVKKAPQPDKIDVTVKNPEAGKPLSYDYFYALVKAARDNGADTIEFNNIRTPEFRDKLLAAALQFKMKLKNPPGVINLEAEHLQSIPPGCRQYLTKHNEAAKKALQKMGREIVPEKGTKFGQGPKAEERTHTEKVFIESTQMEEKLAKTERFMRQQEKRVNSPSTAEYDQNPERGNRDPSKRNNKRNRKTFSYHKGKEI